MAWNLLVQFLFYLGTYVVSALLDKATQPGTPQPGEVQFPRADPEAPIPVIYGTTRVGINVIHKVQVLTGENTVRGSAPFGWSPQHIGYFYYLDALAVVGWGPFSALHDVIVDGTKSLKAIDTVPTFNGFGSDLGALYSATQTISPFPPSEPDDRGSVYTITAGNILGGKFSRGGVGAGSDDAASTGVMRVTRGVGLPIHNARFEGLVGSDLPTYPKLITVAFELFYMGNSETLPAIELVLSRVPPTSSLLMGGTLPNSGRDANPAAILHDLLINTDYGLGLPPSDLDSASFGNMGSALDTVSGGAFDLGMSFVLTEQVSAKTVIQDLLRTVDGVLYVHPTTGLLNVRLLRASDDPFYGYDFDVNVDESSIIDGTFSWSESAADATVNEVKVEFIDRARNFTKNVATVRNVAAIHALGRVESRTVSFLGIQDYATAIRLAQRELKSVSAVLGHGTFEMDRSATTFTPAQPFTLSYAPLGIAGKTVRVLTVRDTPRGTVALEVVEDVYASPAPSFTTVVPDEPTPIGDPAFVRPNVVPSFEICNGNGIGSLAVYDPESAVTAVEFTEDGGATWHAAVNPVSPCYTGPASDYVNEIPRVMVDVYAGWRVTYTDASGNTETLEGNFPVVPRMDRLPAPVLRWSVSGGTVTVTASWTDTFTPDLYMYSSGSGFTTYTSGDTPVTTPYQITFPYPAPGDAVYVSAVRRYLFAQFDVEQESEYSYLTIVGAPTGGVTGGGAAPDSADYLVKTANATLSAERVVTDTSTVAWDWSTAGQAKAQIPSNVALPGSPTTTTPSPGDNSTKIPTTAFVKTAVDAAIAGLSWKQEVRAATTVAGTLASSFENGDAIDGVTLATGDRILIKNQATASENGIYTVNASGAPTRATDADAGSELVNATCYVSEGTTNADTQWTCTTNAPITLGSTSLAFAQLATGGGAFAPDSADYLVKTANGSLSAERVVTDTTTVAWDWATGGQAKANVPNASLDPTTKLSATGTPSSSTYLRGDNTWSAISASTAWRVDVTRTVSVTVDDTVEIGSWGVPEGLHKITVRVDQANSVIAKGYWLSSTYDGTTGAWQLCYPAGSSINGSADFELEIKVGTGAVAFRLRRTAVGTAVGAMTAYVTLEYGGDAAPTFTPSTTTSTSAITARYADRFHPYALSQAGASDKNVIAWDDTNKRYAPSAPLTTHGAQSANRILAGPTSGGSATPTYRALVAADLPNTAVTPGTYGDATHVAVPTVDAQGRITGITNVTISSGGGSPVDLATEIMADSPAGYWKCDENSGTTLADSSGNGFDLTLTGTYTLAVDRIVKGDTSTPYIRFGTTNTSFASRSGSPISLPLSGDRTFEGIVRLNSLSAGQSFFSIMASGELSGANWQGKLGTNGSGVLQDFWEHSAGTNDDNVSGLTLSLLKPFHLATVKDATAKTVTFYIDGVFVKTVTYTNEPTDGSTTKSYVGGNPDDSGSGGSCAHIAVFASKLSAARIAAHAKAAGYF